MRGVEIASRVPHFQVEGFADRLTQRYQASNCRRGNIMGEEDEIGTSMYQYLVFISEVNLQGKVLHPNSQVVGNYAVSRLLRKNPNVSKKCLCFDTRTETPKEVEERQRQNPHDKYRKPQKIASMKECECGSAVGKPGYAYLKWQHPGWFPPELTELLYALCERPMPTS